MHLSILTPEKTIYNGIVTQITLPGAAGKFQILENHAPIISTLVEGNISYTTENSEDNSYLSLISGAVEAKNNIVTVLTF